ncbi:MAG: hypothetical protein EA362_08995 [Saprospirales bacterium]|nr:MAG: hypothetical protein EA362_08995 [Saprospirales bacterium]
MKSILFSNFIFCLFLPCFLYAYQLTDTTKIPISANLISLDIQNNIYAVDRNQRIVKFQQNGEKLNFYQNNKLGRVQQIDVANPHKLLVFYPQQQTIVFLDRNMTELSRIELNQFNIPEVSTVGVSNDNQVWIFDEFDNMLKKMDGSGNVRSISENTIGLWGESLQPHLIRERYNKVFLLDENKGIFVFDNLGNPFQKISIRGIVDFSVINANTLILNHRDKGIAYYRLSEERFTTIDWSENFPGINILQMRIQGNNILIRTNNELIFVRQ